MNVEPEMGSSEDAECPVTLEEYTETGDRQPLKLPRCGHTYSRKGISMLVSRARSLQQQAPTKKGGVCQVQCPTCRLNSRIKNADDCKVDHDIIQMLRKQAAERVSKKLRFQQSRVDGIGVGDSDCSEETQHDYRQYDSDEDSCPVPDSVRISRAAHLSDGQRHEKRQLLFGEVRRAVHNVVKNIVCDKDIEDTCHTLTDYILTNPTEDVLDFITCPLISFEVLHAVWSVFEVEMPDTAEQISDTALRHHAAMLLVLPRTPAQGVEPWEVENKRLSALIAHLLLSCFIDLLSDSEPDQRALKELAEYVAEEGLFLCHIQDDDQYSHIWLQPKHFLYLAARTLRFHLHLRRINGATLMPHRPPSPVRPIAVGLTEKADALIRPLYGDAMPTHLDTRIATIIANNTPDADSALILMHGGADLRAVVEDILEAITLEGERTFTDTPPATFPEPRIGYELKPAAGTAAAACRRSRDAACYARDVQGQRWRRHDLCGRTVAAPPPYSSAGYSDGAASGGAALPAQQRGPGPGAATITPQDLFSGFASAGRASMDTSQRNSSSGAAAYLVPPPAPVGPVATHTRAPAAAAAAATASSSRASGDGCRFVGVPPNAKFTPVEETSGTHMVLPERRGRALCSHFQKHGWCELGDHCAMAHPSGRSVRFNLLGYPIRPGQRVCKFFLEHGKCKFGKNCKFNHPNIAFKEGPYAGSMVRAAGMLGQNFYSSAF